MTLTRGSSSVYKEKNKKPIISITMGDPAGIGPEVIIKALHTPVIYEVSHPLVIGSLSVLENVRKSLKIRDEVFFNSIKELRDSDFNFSKINVLDIEDLQLDNIKQGEISKEGGGASVRYVEKAIEFAIQKDVDAVVTAPISKEAINLAGYKYQGHTEIFAEKTGIKDFAMMLVTDDIKVIHVTLHVSMVDACKLIKKERILRTIYLGYNSMQDLGIKNPRIGVAGLNPHAGESGIFGDEELKEIIPAVNVAREKGINVAGPVSPDVIFNRAMRGEYDLVVAMYHDQGHIAIKTTSFDEGVNVTVGLPIVRTSVGHGTAFDIVGKDKANPKSLINAIKLASKMAVN
ncbi:MAG TPA: 4-hydroxythreonine-4-phosphate dehydrogenase PdxA [Nitrospinota bacterium]|nr:4-hydroxythreonine-4-phosphate dehydrogenase PdxA [Nitrospinota bacterium]